MQSICESASQQRKRPYRVDVKSKTDLDKNFFLLRFRIAQIGHCHKTNIFKYYIGLLNYCVLLKVKLYPSMRLVNFETCYYLFTDRFSVPNWLIS